jgi:uncharacterized protein DUF1524
VLIAEADGPVRLSTDGCRVVSGTWIDPYTGTTFTDPSQLDIDHLVPLANVNSSGGFAWGPAQRVTYANDLTADATLAAVSASANRSKGDRSPDQRMPANHSSWCQYAEDWIAVKAAWHLTVTIAEHDALALDLVGCP